MTSKPKGEPLTKGGKRPPVLTPKPAVKPPGQGQPVKKKHVCESPRLA